MCVCACVCVCVRARVYVCTHAIELKTQYICCITLLKIELKFNYSYYIQRDSWSKLQIVVSCSDDKICSKKLFK